MKSGYYIKWHNVADEMPGQYYEDSKSSSNGFIVRYTFEDTDTECFCEIAHLENGKFIPNFDSLEASEREERREKAKILQWAFLDHPQDYV